MKIQQVMKMESHVDSPINYVLRAGGKVIHVVTEYGGDFHCLPKAVVEAEDTVFDKLRTVYARDKDYGGDEEYL